MYVAVILYGMGVFIYCNCNLQHAESSLITTEAGIAISNSTRRAESNGDGSSVSTMKYSYT